MEPAFDSSRRDTLMKLGKGLFCAVAGWTAGNFTVPLGKELSKRSDGYIHEKISAVIGPCGDIKDIFANLFLGTQEKVSLIPAQDNPNVESNNIRLETDPFEIFTHTTLAAARSFAGVLDQVEDRIKRVDQLVTINGEGNLITFGSPTSNSIARTALRYAEIGDGKAGSDHFKTDAFDLKILYELNGDRIKNHESVHRFCHRMVNGRRIDIPNWGVQNSKGAILLPETRDGAIVQDYLVISSLPNTFSRSSLIAGHRIINFGGTHREGTEAVKHLFTNESILKDLCERVNKEKGGKPEDPFWQAIILVECSSGAPYLTKIIDFAKVDVHQNALERLTSIYMQELKRYNSL